MPVIVPPDKHDVWLDPDVNDFNMIRDILKPYDASLILESGQRLSFQSRILTPWSESRPNLEFRIAWENPILYPINPAATLPTRHGTEGMELTFRAKMANIANKRYF